MHLQKPYHLFPVASFLMGAMMVLFWSPSMLADLVVYKIFVGGSTGVYALLMYSLLCWTVYIPLNEKLNKRLMWLHIVITLGFFAYFFATGFWLSKLKATSAEEAYIMRQLMINKTRVVSIASWKGIVFVIGQLIFAFNVAISLFYKRRPQR